MIFMAISLPRILSNIETLKTISLWKPISFGGHVTAIGGSVGAADFVSESFYSLSFTICSQNSHGTKDFP